MLPRNRQDRSLRRNFPSKRLKGAAVNRNEIITKLASETTINRSVVVEVVAAYEAAIAASLSRGEPVVLTGFGSFKLVQRSQRILANPTTGVPINVKACLAPKFTPSSHLSAMIEQVDERKIRSRSPRWPI
jgi:DNA-binding protein HU-beta